MVRRRENREQKEPDNKTSDWTGITQIAAVECECSGVRLMQRYLGQYWLPGESRPRVPEGVPPPRAVAGQRRKAYRCSWVYESGLEWGISAGNRARTGGALPKQANNCLSMPPASLCTRPGHPTQQLERFESRDTDEGTTRRHPDRRFSWLWACTRRTPVPNLPLSRSAGAPSTQAHATRSESTRAPLTVFRPG